MYPTTADYYQEIEKRHRIVIENLIMANVLNRTTLEYLAKGEPVNKHWLEKKMWMANYAWVHRDEKIFQLEELEQLFLIHNK